ncbi:UDP-forming cellulose synthase catalytic subunit [Zavarzinia compransoris]|uniref:UDP-forming cellulose synthase catalytic subunit n=1 Tax=Zavarzinia marina TaxID=2911065 RepID=UPI001F1BCB85|nr:UDP-forming cellulose synthase catalytic subunit [Zavarzinia marina]MCF4166138.1 UDP-forming cellulose synthase catalytic subunit [Zavarzinia marina]
MAVTGEAPPREPWYRRIRPGSGWFTEQLVPLEALPRWVLYLVIGFGMLLSVPVIVAPLDLRQQLIFGALVFLIALLVNRLRSQPITMVLSMLSVLVSTRYLYWRLTETLDFTNWFGGFLGVGLVMAEIYAWLILILGFFQTAAPLDRPAEKLPDDTSLWPTVDVYIPTYNEELEIVADTILAALNLDYPEDKLRVYVLDDGRREQFREFAEKAGAGYIVRPDNAHAKAGNLNHALKLTDGDLIAVFDADHVTTRGFLQMTVGGFLTDPALALVQTPHHFYSPDPFERNIRGGASIPNEGELFYGPVQKGNDLWNAAFFCGSCAVIRRAALDDVGGFAVETVTEDAHTALRMQKRGWNTAYLDVALAAGRATERLVLHVGQRVRWARGMTQILRRENPLFGGKLTLAQRLCYLNAMLHFQFALPRIVFLTAPIAFLLLNENIIASTAPMVLAYAGPHLLHAALTNTRVHGPYRLTFWGELYETSLSFHLVWPVLAAMINPRLGKFNVTEKGGLLEREYFDFRIARFHIFTLVLVVLGLGIGVYRLIYVWGDETIRDVLLMNVAWASFNAVILMGAMAAAFETRQIRRTIRLPIIMPVTVFTATGHAVCATTVNMSMGGAMLRMPEGTVIEAEDVEAVEFPVADRTEVFPATGVAINGDSLRISFGEMPVSLYRLLVGVVFGRADAWVERRTRPLDKPSRAVFSILRATFGLFLRWRPKAAPAAQPKPAAEIAAAVQDVPSRTMVPGARVPGARVADARAPAAGGVLRGALPFALAAALALGFGAAPDARAQNAPVQLVPGTAAPDAGPTTDAGATGARMPQPPEGLDPGPDSRPTVAPGSASPAASAPPGVPPRPTEGPAAPAPAAMAPATSAPYVPAVPAAPAAGSRNVTVSLQDLGAREPLRLLGVESEIGFPLDIRQDEVVTAAKITVEFAYSPSLIPDLSHLSALVNGVVVGTVALPRENAGGMKVEIPVNPALFVRRNRVGVRVIAHYTMECEDPVHSSLWSIIDNATRLDLTLQSLPPATDLAALPAPFFDAAERKALKLPIALPPNPSPELLKAAAVVAGYFAAEAGERGADFPVTLGSVATGDHVVVATPQSAPAGLDLPALTGPTIANVANRGGGRILLIAGRNDAELNAAAATLALGSVTLTGPSATVGTPKVAPREAYDAPRWVPDDRPVRFGELVEPDTLQGYGLIPGPLGVPFRTAPDLFVWSDRGLPMVVRYRYPRGEWMDLERSRLDVSINGQYLKSLPATGPNLLDDVRDIVGDDFVLNEARVKVPPFQVYGRNRLEFFYDLRPRKKGECEGVLPTNVVSAIDPDSTLDISGAERFAVMPNLSFFAGAGFPYTKYADMGETAVILPERPKADEIRAFLDLMGRFTEFTGFPPLRLTLLFGTGDLAPARGRDVIVVGTLGDRLNLERLATDGPLRVADGRLAIATGRPIDRAYALLDGDDWVEQQREAGELLMTSPDFAGLVGERIGGADDRSLVMVVASKSERLPILVRSLNDPDVNAAVQGDLAVLDGNAMRSFRVGDTYTVGSLGFYGELRWYFRNRPLVLIAFAVGAMVLIGIVVYTLLRLITKARLRRKATT